MNAEMKHKWRYYYGMRLRGFSLGCQPIVGFVERLDDETNKYHDILVYDRPLLPTEVRDYGLDFIKVEDEEQ